MMMALACGLSAVATAQDKPKADKAKIEQKATDKQGKSCCSAAGKKDMKAKDKQEKKACDKKGDKKGAKACDKASKETCSKKDKK